MHGYCYEDKSNRLYCQAFNIGNSLNTLIEHTKERSHLYIASDVQQIATASLANYATSKDIMLVMHLSNDK